MVLSVFSLDSESSVLLFGIDRVTCKVGLLDRVTAAKVTLKVIRSKVNSE